VAQGIGPEFKPQHCQKKKKSVIEFHKASPYDKSPHTHIPYWLLYIVLNHLLPFYYKMPTDY
jgi:hypothetical protein